jgi:hypothetical protein
MKKIKQMKVALFLFSFLSVIVFMSVSSLALPDVPKKSSNTSGNMANNGRVLKYDGWVYYSFDESGLYRMKEDGSQKKKICDGMYDNLTAYDGYIYGYCRYTKTNNPEETGLFRLKPDGTERVKISDKSMLFVTIYDGWIYYTSFDDNFKPYKMKLDATDDQKLSDYSASYINVDNQWVYFQNDANGGRIYKVKHDGSQITEVSDHGNMYTYLNIDGEWIYFSGHYFLYKMKVDGTELTPLFEELINNVNSKDSWIYFSVFEEGIYRIKTDGTQLQKLRDVEDFVSGISLTDEWLYYEVYDVKDSSTRVYRMRLDGSSHQKFKITEDHVPDEVENVKIRIDGKFGEYSNVPLNLYGRILLPFREILKNLGVPDDDKHIIWDGKNRTVTVKKDNITILLTIGKNTALVNGKEYVLDVAPIIYNDRTYIPTRFIAESLNKKVLWDGEKQIVSICEPAEFEKVKDILAKTNDAMVNSVERYSVDQKNSMKYNNDYLDYEIQMTAKLEIDSKKRLCNIVGERKILETGNITNFNSEETSNIYCWCENEKIYLKDENYDLWYESELTEDEWENFKRRVLSNYSYINADDLICSGFTVDETDEHYILKGEHIFDELISGALYELDIVNEIISGTNTELLINKKTYYLEKINTTVTGKEKSSYGGNFSIAVSLENTNFNSEARVTAPEGFDPDKLINKKAVELVNFISQAYLYFNEIDNFEEKSKEFITKKDFNFDDVKQYIEAIKADDDVFTVCVDENSLEYGYKEEQIETKDLGKDAVYIKIKSFTEDVGDKFIEEADKIENSEDKTLVIDLRDNGGGFIISANDILDYLLPRCLMNYYISRSGDMLPVYSNDDYKEFKQILILVNENTASSAELLALGLKKHLKNTTVIGRTTLGKGVGQLVYRDDDKKFSVYLVSFYWNVKENVMKSGITPDIVVNSDSDYLKEVEKLLKSKR